MEWIETEGKLFRKILVATDGSENAAKAASYGVNIAKTTGAEVHALYVISTKNAVTTRTVKGWTDSFEEGLAKRGKAALAYVEEIGREAGVIVKPVCEKGIPAELILNYSEGNAIDLIVMGTHGLTGIQKFLIGSVSENVLRHSKVPVMVIR